MAPSLQVLFEIMAVLKRIVPIFPVSDLAVALEYYHKLGFATRTYDPGGYGFASLDTVEIHLGTVPAGVRTAPMSAYLFVDDADEWAHRWTAAGADVRPPEDTPWQQHEGVVIDPDGNIIRFGSPIQSASRAHEHSHGSDPSHRHS
jgi:predicted enzyme related to lactoylglutathione lyase